MRNKLALVVAVVLGLIAVYGVAQLIQSNKTKYEEKNKSIRVAAAGKRLIAGTVMDPSCLLKEEVTNSAGQVTEVRLGKEILEQAFTTENIPVSEEDKLITLTINHTVERGEPLLVSYFRQPVEKLDKGLHLGERAITLRVDAISGVASNLAPDSHVDIIGTFPMEAEGPGGAVKSSAAAASRTLLLFQNITILALDSRTRDDDYASAANGVPRSRTYTSVTVAVTPEEANILVFAQQYGSLTLALRPPTDSTPPGGQLQVDAKTVMKLAEEAEKARQERLKSNTPIQATPAP